MNEVRIKFEKAYFGNREIDYIVTAVKLPTGGVEIASNNSHLREKVEYILSAYDEDMRLKTNTKIQMVDCMILYT